MSSKNFVKIVIHNLLVRKRKLGYVVVREELNYNTKQHPD